MTGQTIKRLNVGDTVEIELPYSEVCMHMKVAGKTKHVELLDNGMAQLYTVWHNNVLKEKFSFPITHGEAGIYKDEEGYYTYV